jgi:Zn-dependent peptidase ImmA (M78 family)
MPTLTKKHIEARAHELLVEHLGQEPHVPIDLDRLVSNLNGRVEVRFDGYPDPESLVVAADGSFTIFVPTNTSRARDRFTIAHELGHLILHHQPNAGPKTFLRYGRSPEETEANAFAGALLMPADRFRREWARCNGDPRTLAQTFQVSQSAADVRGQVLRLP